MNRFEIAHAFSFGRFADVTAYLTDTTTWEIVGEKTLKGISQICAHCDQIASYFAEVTTDFRMIAAIENEEKIAIQGTAAFLKNGVQLSFVSACDVYVFGDNNTLISITSFCIAEK